jgi:hypothetical protein
MNFRNRDNSLLFTGGDLSAVLHEQIAKLQWEIDGFTSDYILKVNLDDLADHLTGKYHIGPISLQVDNIHIGNSGDTTVDMSHDFRYTSRATRVPATFAEFVVPFVGDSALFQLRSSTSNYNPPHANIAGQELTFRYTSIEHNPGAMRAEFDNDLKNVAQFLKWGNSDIHSYNGNLENTIRGRLSNRKEKILKDKGMIEALGFPIKARDSNSLTCPAPIVRKKLPIQKPIVSSGDFNPEPRLEMEHYNHILKVISSMIQVVERSPKTFSKMGEEELRTNILVQLNGHYEGQATGETFNYEGKTDILIRVEERNIFIGECKIWKGPEGFKATIDQLLGYTAWRDSKTAIILFNRNKNTSSVVAQISDLVKQHPNFKREVTDQKNESSFRFILHHRDDKNRDLVLTVLIFDVPV